MGEIPAETNMVSAVILNPQTGEQVPENTTFNVTLQVANLQAGKVLVIFDAYEKKENETLIPNQAPLPIRTPPTTQRLSSLMAKGISSAMSMLQSKIWAASTQQLHQMQIPLLFSKVLTMLEMAKVFFRLR